MLNDNQILAVNHITGPCLTLAGPGSGKTTVLVERILNLIRSGVEPSQILVITFTKDAAREMKGRFEAKSKPDVFEVSFGTFHSVFYHILRSDRKYRGYELLNGKDKHALIKECADILALGLKNSEDFVRLEKDISCYYNTGESLENLNTLIEKDEFKAFIDLFEERKRAHGCMDFDDMLIKTRNLLRDDKKALAKWQERFSYFLVDELQDINGVQFEVLKLLIKNHPCGSENIFGVGDDDQSIYGFRGASPSFMMAFPKVFENTRVIELDVNYRSCSDIVYDSKRLIDKNKERFFKDYKAFNKTPGTVSIHEFDDTLKEAEYIAKRLKSEFDGGSLLDTAILYRNRSQSVTVYSMLKKYRLPVFSDEPMQELSGTFVAKDILAYLRLAVGPMYRKDLIQILNRPERSLMRGGIIGSTVDPENWLEFYPKNSTAYERIDKLINQLALISHFSPYSAVNFIKKGIGYDEYLRNRGRATSGNSDELLAISDSFLSYASGFDSIEALINDSEREDEEPVRAERKDQKICMYTFHGSKGLEFDRVFILDANEGITPSHNAGPENLEEERRMFYVAMTRSKKELNICVAKKRGDAGLYPSRFVSELLPDREKAALSE